MAITIKKLETFTGKRTSTMPDPDDLTKTVTPKFLPNSPKIDESEFPTEPS